MGLSLFTSCEDPYAGQMVASPKAYDQLTLSDTTFIATATNASVTLTESGAADSTALLTIGTPVKTDSLTTVSYQLQISSTASFATVYTRKYTKALNAGSTVKILNSDLNLIIDSMGNTAATTLYSRLIATLVKGSTQLTQKSYSAATGSTASFSATPYSLLKPFTANKPRLWYLIGGAIGDGNWNNSVAGLGVSLYPMNIVTGNAYNKSGDGTFTYTGYFESSKGFKLIRDLGGWSEQWGISGSTYVHNDGGASDIKVAADGWYTITLNSIKNTLTVEATTAPSTTTYTSMGVIGDINSWSSDVVMTKAASTNSHIWYATYTFSGAATQGVKIRANGGWDVSWGGATFPYGYGVSGGDNIMYTAGTYTIIFNDLSGTYYFVAN